MKLEQFNFDFDSTKLTEKCPALNTAVKKGCFHLFFQYNIMYQIFILVLLVSIQNH